MDLSFSPEETAFRDEVRAWVADALPADIKAAMERGEKVKKDDLRRWHKILHEKGWIAPAWPKEYGGTGWTATQRYIFANEMALAGAPDLPAFGLKMVGPVIYTYGSEEQKREYLPGILNGDVWWCQGYSEPGSGSDLASLKTKAVSDGDEYVVNGSKIWTTGAHEADWIFCLVRTDDTGKKQEGISFLLIDMKTPGIEVSPIIIINGDHTVNQVFFNDVRVPKRNLIGKENEGWTYAKFLLVNERNGIAQIGAKKHTMARIRKLAASTQLNGHRLADDPGYQRRLAETEVALMALEYSELRFLSGQKTDHAPGTEANMMKVAATQLQQSMSELFIEIAGYYSYPFDGFRDTEGSNEPPVVPEDAGGAMHQFLYGRASTIYGGSNEIQRDVIAKVLLSL
ncbi:MAG: pimeloyl-CoA dehydrogenase large subunit [Alphaproteobacteria bacterium]|nr:pimeloyl-CoA dehydrogenase large subunit [Alphaproteobacteria bacterium]